LVGASTISRIIFNWSGILMLTLSGLMKEFVASVGVNGFTLSILIDYQRYDFVMSNVSPEYRARVFEKLNNQVDMPISVIGEPPGSLVVTFSDGTTIRFG
jgi:hypothetical protein